MGNGCVTKRNQEEIFLNLLRCFIRSNIFSGQVKKYCMFRVGQFVMDRIKWKSQSFSVITRKLLIQDDCVNAFEGIELEFGTVGIGCHTMTMPPRIRHLLFATFA